MFLLVDLRRFDFHLRHQFVHLIDYRLYRLAFAQVDAGFLQFLHRMIVATALEQGEVTFGRRHA